MPERLRNRFASLKERFRPKEKIKFWTSTPYFERYLQNRDLNQSLKILQLELATFFHEYVGMFAVKSYHPYTHKGVYNLFPESITTLGRNNELALASRGFETLRASLETRAMLALEQWLADENVLVGEALVLVSPRGKKSEGYLGEEKVKNNYINVFIKTGPNECRMIQYLNYDLNADLIAFQNFLQTVLGGQVFAINHSFTLNNQLAVSTAAEIEAQANSKINPKETISLATGNLSVPHSIIATLVQLPHFVGSEQLEQIQAFIFQKESSWPVRLNDLPTINRALFDQELDKILALCSQEAEKLLTTLAHVHHSLSNPEQAFDQKSHSAISPDLFPNFAAKFDELVAICREHFLKWVEDHASNYQGASHSYQLSIQEILERWQIKCDELDGLRISQQARKKAEKIARGVSLSSDNPLKLLSKNLICPPTDILKVKTLRLDKLPAEMMRSPELLQKIEQDIKNNKYVEIQLKERWKVPKTYLESPGCRTKSGIDIGPCGVPLLKDPYAVLVSEYENWQALTEAAATLAQTSENNPDVTAPNNETEENMWPIVSSVGLDALLNGSWEENVTVGPGALIHGDIWQNQTPEPEKLLIEALS
ncbi:MAG: hypothetical protein PVJ09_04285 [Candidatus Woesebacteria bacterium]|jgi:hypothetical protein